MLHQLRLYIYRLIMSWCRDGKVLGRTNNYLVYFWTWRYNRWANIPRGCEEPPYETVYDEKLWWYKTKVPKENTKSNKGVRNQKKSKDLWKAKDSTIRKVPSWA